MANCLADCFAISLDYLKTRLSRSAQESGAKGRSASVEGLAALLCLRFALCRALGVGTMRLRNLAGWGPSLCDGASTP